MQTQQPQTSPVAVETSTETGTTQEPTNRPLQTARSGPIGASIWQNQNDKIGITLSRSWSPQEGETKYSSTFYAGNREDLHKAIDQACDIAQALERAVANRVDDLQTQVKEETRG